MDKKAMYKLSYGLFVLTAREDEKDNGCIINTAIQAASEPNQLSICVNKANYTHDMIGRTGKFTVSVLSQNAQFELFKHFGFQSGRDTNKFETFEKFCVYDEPHNDYLYTSEWVDFISKLLTEYGFRKENIHKKCSMPLRIDDYI